MGGPPGFACLESIGKGKWIMLRLFLVTVVVIVCVSPVEATLFTDDFNTGPSVLWGNEQGNWQVVNQAYKAQAPSSWPNAHSSLPFVLDDFEISLDINSLVDGGVWLRSSAAPGTLIGRTGILLVARSHDLYWHVVPTGQTYGGSLNAVSSPGGNIHLRIAVQGNNYALYVNHSPTPATTLVDATFSQGQTALYSFNLTQSFDNVMLIPEPGAMGLLVAGALVFLRRRTVPVLHP